MIVHASHTEVNGHPLFIVLDDRGHLLILPDEEPEPVAVAASSTTLTLPACRVCGRETPARDGRGRACCAQCQRVEMTLTTLPDASEYLPSQAWRRRHRGNES
jgi:hypothetical protein